MARKRWATPRERDRRWSLVPSAAVGVLALLALSACGRSDPAETKVLGVEYERPASAGPDVSPAAPLTAPAPVPVPPVAAVPAVAPAQAVAKPVAPVAAATSTPSASTAPATPATVAAVPAVGSVSGVVRAAGVPVAAAKVVLAHDATRAEAATDAAGSYRIDGLVPGDYRIEVLDPGNSSAACDAAGTCITTRPSRAEVREVSVAPGATTEADFSF